MGHRRRVITTGAALTLAVAVGGAGAASQRLSRGGGQTSSDPADFTTHIDNPYWPMRPGTRWVYRETTPDGGRARDVVIVTRRTKRIANGVEARVVSDVSTEHGKLAEKTEDYYAQDRAGNIWYFGENTKTYENGKFKSSEGSFEAGVDGAQPGIIMRAHPRRGMSYKQEDYPGHAEDRARILTLREQAEVPFGHFKRTLLTRETTPLEPKTVEYKLYARGVGPVLALGISGENDRSDLVRFRRGR
jgi:hypothetical protein